MVSLKLIVCLHLTSQGVWEEGGTAVVEYLIWEGRVLRKTVCILFDTAQ